MPETFLIMTILVLVQMTIATVLMWIAIEREDARSEGAAEPRPRGRRPWRRLGPGGPDHGSDPGRVEPPHERRMAVSWP